MKRANVVRMQRCSGDVREQSRARPSALPIRVQNFEINPAYVGPTQHGETSRSSGRPIRHLVSERSCVSARMRSCTWVWANVLENGRVVREVPADEVKRNARLREVCLGR